MLLWILFFWLSMGVSCMIVSITLFDSWGEFSGWSYPMKTAEIEVLTDVAMVTIFCFYIWCAHWRLLTNATEQSVCCGDAAICQVTLTTCYFYPSTGIQFPGNKKIMLCKEKSRVVTSHYCTVYQNNWTTKLMTVTLSNLNRFSKFFHC